MRKKQWVYENSRGEKVLVRDSVSSLLVNVNKYASIGDLVVQALPAPASLIWGGVKVLLQVTKLSTTTSFFFSICLPALLQIIVTRFRS